MPPVLRKILIACGILSSMLFAAMIWGISYEGYSRMSQVPSELTAIGAPTRALWARLGWIYTALLIAFGCGLLEPPNRNRAVRRAGIFMLAYASLALLWPFAAMHQREVLVAGGAAAFGTPFRVYSISTIVVLLAFGALTFLEAPRLQADLPTPWIGLWERINISVFLLWVAVLAGRSLRRLDAEIAEGARHAVHPKRDAAVPMA